MTTIDQRILIPAPPIIVWEYLSKLDNNPTWQVNCEQIIFLSQRRSGVGTRWRETHTGRQEYVYEISTWYDTLGYEYEFVDGPNIQSSKGRLRLQEIPEGTIVQWSYIYEAGGVLGGIRNALTTQRRLEADMVESLKNLWKIVKRTGTLEGYEARSLMRDGPKSPQERAQYHSRYGEEGLQTGESDTATDLYTRLKNEEPPVSTEDTRPGKAAAAAQIPVPGETPHPADAPDAAPALPVATDNRFAPPPEKAADTYPAVATPAAPEPQPEAESPYAPTEAEPVTPEPVTVPEPEALAVEPAAPSTASDMTDPITPEAATPGEPDALHPKVPAGKDTSEMSIWEVFGIPSPTDSQRMRAIQAGEEAQREYEAEADDPAPVLEQEIADSAPVASQMVASEDATLSAREAATDATDHHAGNGDNRTGLRVNARKKMVRVRRPGK